MAAESPAAQNDVARIAAQVPPPGTTTSDGLNIKQAFQEAAEKIVDDIEMIGEEEAAQLQPSADASISAGMRYLHCSRTIHQLVTDRNRAVGVYLAVATLLWTASTALLNANPTGDHIIPLESIKKWCLPFTFGTMTVLAVLAALLLIRTRVGLIYEVAKMNVLLGLPIGRVQRVNPLSIFFIMHLIICLAGSSTAGLFALYMLRLAGLEMSSAAGWSALLGVVLGAALVVLYIATVLHTTTDTKLQRRAG